MTEFLIPARSMPTPEYIFGNRTPVHVVSLRACEPKHLFDPITWNEILVTILCFVGGSLAAASGLGGGGIYVPLLLLLPHYEPHKAIPISTVTIFGSALSNVFLLLLQTHPTATSAGTVTVKKTRTRKKGGEGGENTISSSSSDGGDVFEGVLPESLIAAAETSEEVEEIQVQRKKPLIDFDTALVLEPIVLAGTEVGVVLNMLFPGYLMTIVLIVVLVIASARTCWKGVRMCRLDCQKNGNEKENGEEKEGKGETETEAEKDGEATETATNGADTDAVTTSDESTGGMGHMTLTTSAGSINVTRGTMIDASEFKSDSETEPLLQQQPGLPKYDDYGIEYDDDKQEAEEEKEKIATPDWVLWLQWCDGCRFQFVQVVILMVLWGIVCLASLLRGSKRTESIAGVKLCSWEYFLILAFSWLLLVCCGIVIGAVLMILFRLKVRHGVKFAEEEVKWTPKNAFLIPLFFLIAGIVAGLLGLGGGIVVSPLLLELGMNPQSSMATSGFMVLLTSSCTTMQFAVLGQLSYDYSLWYAGFGLLSAIVGQTTIFFFVKKFGKSKVYIIVFVIATTLFVCCMLMGGVGIKDIVANILAKDWNAFKFQKFC